MSTEAGRSPGASGHPGGTRTPNGPGDHRTVSWSDGQVLFGLVSMLDYEALLECADRLRIERANQTRL